MLFKKVFLEISGNSQENTCARDFFHKVSKPATLLKNSLWHRCFTVNFAKFLRTPFFTEHHLWLLLPIRRFFLCFNNQAGAQPDVL